MNNNSTTVIAKINNATSQYILLTQCEEIRAFNVQNHVDYM